MNKEEKKLYWKQHYDNFCETKISKSEYCRNHLISLSAFKNWVYKFIAEKEQYEKKEQLNLKDFPNQNVQSKLFKSKNNHFIEIKSKPKINQDFVKKKIQTATSMQERAQRLVKISFQGFSIEVSELPEPQWLVELSKLIGGIL